MLKGKAALVTGASKGVGKGIALALARAGCHVVVNYHTDRTGAEATVDEVRALGPEAVAVGGNVALPEAVDALFAAALDRFPKVDIVVNNAGTQVFKPLLDMDEADWDRVVDTNLKGCFLCTQRAGRHMREHGGGHILNIGSGCNKLAFPGLSSYTASKGGMETLTKVAAAELGQYGIRVNCVAPGAIEIERTKQEAGDYAGTWAQLTPLGRVGTPEDVGRVVVALAGEAGEFVTGQTIWVDGGLFSKPAWPYE